MWAIVVAFLWPFYGLMLHFMVFHGRRSSFLAVIDPNSFGLVPLKKTQIASHLCLSYWHPFNLISQSYILKLDFDSLGKQQRQDTKMFFKELFAKKFQSSLKDKQDFKTTIALHGGQQG